MSLAAYTSETHNLQRIFRPLLGYVGMYHSKGYGFLAILFWNRVSIWNNFGLK